MRAFVKAFAFPAGESREEAVKALRGANKGALVQAIGEGVASNASFIAMLAAQTFFAEESGGMLARKPEVDLLLRLARTTQISAAIRSAGAKAGEGFVVLVAGRKAPKVPKGFDFDALPERPLSGEEYAMVESAALLSAQKA